MLEEAIMKDIIIDITKFNDEIQKGKCDVWVSESKKTYALPLSRIIEEALKFPLSVSWAYTKDPIEILSQKIDGKSVINSETGWNFQDLFTKTVENIKEFAREFETLSEMGQNNAAERLIITFLKRLPNANISEFIKKWQET